MTSKLSLSSCNFATYYAKLAPILCVLDNLTLVTQRADVCKVFINYVRVEIYFE